MLGGTISRRSSRSSDNVEFGHFTLFCRGRQRNVQRVITHVESYYIVLLIKFFVSDVPVAVVAVVFLNSLTPYCVCMLEIINTENQSFESNAIAIIDSQDNRTHPVAAKAAIV